MTPMSWRSQIKLPLVPLIVLVIGVTDASGNAPIAPMQNSFAATYIAKEYNEANITPEVFKWFHFREQRRSLVHLAPTL